MSSTVKVWIEEISSVECPTCGAAAGKTCIENADPYSAHSKGVSVHLSRWEAYDIRSREPLLIRKMREATKE